MIETKKIIFLMIFLVLLNIVFAQRAPPPPPPTPVTPGAQAPCIENWNCTEWSPCINGTQTRNCTDLNVCGTVVNKPVETQSCEVPKPKEVEEPPIEKPPEGKVPPPPTTQPIEEEPKEIGYLIPIIIIGVIIAIIVFIAIFIYKKRKKSKEIKPEAIPTKSSPLAAIPAETINQLKSHIRSQQAYGRSLEDIKAELIKTGWTTEQIDEVYKQIQ